MKNLRDKIRVGQVEPAEAQHVSRTLASRAREAYVWLRERGQAVNLSAQEVYYQDWRRNGSPLEDVHPGKRSLQAGPEE